MDTEVSLDIYFGWAEVMESEALERYSNNLSECEDIGSR